MKLEGTFTAQVTPFHDDFSLDLEGLKILIRRQLQAGIDGLVILGTTGEAPTLTVDEQREVIKTAVKEVNGKVPLIVGTGRYSTQETIARTKEAQSLGADAALVVTPYYNRPTQEGLYRHFEALATSCTLPFLVYNVPGRTGGNLEPATLKRMADLPTLCGIKECNFSQVSDIIELIPNVPLFCGDDSLTLAMIALGAKGVIAVASNLATERMMALTRAALNDSLEEAREHHYALYPLFKAAALETNPAPIKEALNHFHLPAGPVRLPLSPLQSSNKQQLITVLKRLYETQPTL